MSRRRRIGSERGIRRGVASLEYVEEIAERGSAFVFRRYDPVARLPAPVL
jgi:hypothetical protein